MGVSRREVTHLLESATRYWTESARDVFGRRVHTRPTVPWPFRNKRHAIALLGYDKSREKKMRLRMRQARKRQHKESTERQKIMTKEEIRMLNGKKNERWTPTSPTARTIAQLRFNFPVTTILAVPKRNGPPSNGPDAQPRRRDRKRQSSLRY